MVGKPLKGSRVTIREGKMIRGVNEAKAEDTQRKIAFKKEKERSN